MKNKNDEINIVKDNYRLRQISKLIGVKNNGSLNCQTMPLTYGLGLEKRCTDGEAYYVIAFLKFNKNVQVVLDPVDMRMLDISDDEWPLVKKLINKAKKLLEESIKLPEEND